MSSPGASTRPDELMELARHAYETHLDTLARHGVSVDPKLRFTAGSTPEVYYEPETLTINVGVADLEEPSGRMYWLFVARLLGVRSAEAAVAAFAQQLPLLVVHEIAHHLRHRYGAPITNDFVEEQVANTLAIAFLAEHPDYQGALASLREWAGKAAPALAAMVPAAASARAGFRLDLGEVLVERGLISRDRLEELRRLAQDMRRPLDEILDMADVVPESDLAGAAQTHKAAELYFNGRYMADPTEYQSFHIEWYRAYLARSEFPTFVEALETHVLTDDWERTRAVEVESFLERALRDADEDLAVSAAEALAPGDAPLWSRLPLLLPQLRPRVGAAVLRAVATSGRASTEPSWAEAATLALTDGHPELRGAAASALAGTGDLTAATTLRSMLCGTEREQDAALRAVQDLPPTGLSEPLVSLAKGGSRHQRALAVMALAREPTAASLSARVAALSDADDEVRGAAAQSLAGTTDASALARLAEALSDPAAAVRAKACQALRAAGHAAGPILLAARGDWGARADAALILHDLGHDRAPRQLSVLLEEMVAAARELTSVPDTGSHARPEALALLRSAMEQERQRLGMLCLRLASAIHLSAGGQTLIQALGPTDFAAFPAALDLASSGLPPDLRDDILGLLARSGADGPAARPPEDHRWVSHHETWLRTLVSETLSDPSDAHDERGTPMLTSIEKLVFLRAVPIFRAVPIRALQAMAEEFTVERYAAGDRVFQVGEDDPRVYVIAMGRVLIDQDQPDGTYARIAEVGPGQGFGETAMLEGRPRSAAATAAVDTTLLALHRDEFLRLGRQEPEILIEVTRTLAGLLRQANADLG